MSLWHLVGRVLKWKKSGTEMIWTFLLTPLIVPRVSLSLELSVRTTVPRGFRLPWVTQVFPSMFLWWALMGTLPSAVIPRCARTRVAGLLVCRTVVT